MHNKWSLRGIPILTTSVLPFTAAKMCIEATWPLDIVVVDSNWVHKFVLYFDLSSVVHTVLACLWPIYYRRGLLQVYGIGR